MKKKIVILFAFVILSMLFFAFSTGASAEHYSIEGIEIPIEILINDNIIKTPCGSFLEDGTVYVPVKAICDAIGANVTWNNTQKLAIIEKNNQFVTFETGENHSAVLFNDRLFVPARKISEAFGYEVSWDDYYYEVNIKAEDVTVPDECIEKYFTKSDILLIAQVLHCETYSYDFMGQIAVANLICNRAASPLFPDSVHGVIYDCRGGSPQFSLAYNGRINNVPKQTYILASKCALGGVVVAKDCLFYQAQSSRGTWIDKNRKYAVTIGGNSFYY